MAITYKTQGAGVGTETSGAALSPQCPATVDAGDILIAHVFWEGTTTAPSTPSGWDLLSGPHVIETTIARHWVFGRIADGTEDGAAVAFGAPAVTTQRGARIYSFAGRVAGTITELVTGFAPTSHATDPQMPTVSTTLAGALAVALIAQNDNNTFGNPTGESGGDWVEALAAEFSANLTPGFSMGICSATPTGDPGTITGGSIATTNDPVGVIGFEIKQSNNIAVAPSVGTVVVAGIAPTVSATNNQNITTAVGTIVISGLAPTANIGVLISTAVGEVSIVGVEPTVSVTDNKNITTDIGLVSIEGLVPTISVTDNKNIIADVGSVLISGLEPTVQTPVSIQSGLGEVTIDGLAPTVSVTNHIAVFPETGTVVISGMEPSVGSGLNVTPGIGEVIIAGFAPTINVTASAQTQTGEVVIEGLAPTIQTPLNIITGLGEVVIDGLVPIISIGGGEALVETKTGLVLVSGIAPTVTGGRKRFLIRKSRVANDANKFSTVDHANLKSKVDDI
jgi:hypothetical protein